MKKCIPILLLALAFCAPAKAQNRPHAITNFVVLLSGTNDVTGQGVLTLDGNVLNFAIGDFLGSPTDPSNAGIYGPAHEGKNGRLIADHFGSQISPPEGIAYLGGLELTTAQIAQLRAGLLYVEVNFHSGSIRGQIVPEQD